MLWFLLPQLLNQVLNRVTAEKNLFDRVVNLRLPGTHRHTDTERQTHIQTEIDFVVCVCSCAAGLESVDHYPILVAVTGILVRILVDGHRQG